MTSPQELATVEAIEQIVHDLVHHNNEGNVTWLDSHSLARSLDATLDYTQHCLREALHVERFCYGEGWYIAYIDAHLAHQPGTRRTRSPQRRPACPCCQLQTTTTGECPL